MLKRISVLVLIISLSGVMNVVLYAAGEAPATEENTTRSVNEDFEIAFEESGEPVEHSLEDVLGSLGGGEYVPVLYGEDFSFDTTDWSLFSGMTLPARDGEQVVIDGWRGPEDLSADIKFAYDDDHLYLYAQITDDRHAAVAGAEMWNGDSLQVAFSSDGVQYGSEIGLAHVGGEGQVHRWSAGEATQGADTIQLETSRSEADKLTTYQASIPWKAILKEKPADITHFDLLINENDSNSRRGYMEWTGGIGRGKEASLFGTMELIDASAGWSLWVGGKSTVIAGTSEPFKLNIPNYGSESLELAVEIPGIGLEEQVTLPPGSAYVEQFELIFEEPGLETIDVSATDQKSNMARSQQFKVLVNPSPSSLEARFDELERRLPALREQLDQAATRQIPVDYEMVNYTVLKNFIGYGREDVRHDFLERAGYVADELEQLYQETQTQLNGYLNGTAQALDVPRYVTGRPDIEGYSFMADTVSTAHPEKVKRPTFFIGYGHFSQVRKDVPQFKDYGANMIQIEIGPQSVILPLDGIVEWQSSASGDVLAGAVTSSEARSGDASVLINNDTEQRPNTFFRLVQNVTVQPDTTYTLSGWVKGEDVSGTWFGGGPGWSIRESFPTGTYDWTEVTQQFTTAADQTEFELMILTEDRVGALWIDDITLTEAGSEENLVANGGFESLLQADEGKEWAISTHAIEDDILRVLDQAAEHDVAVTLLVSPHYFPSWALAKWPELRSDQIGFIKYNIDHPMAREMVEDYLSALIPLVKDKPALHSITLSNEPVYQAHVDNSQLAQWQAYLEEVHGTLERLNEVNAADYASFADVPVPSLSARTPLAYDWIQYNNQLFSGWHEWMADIVRDMTEDVPLHVKIMRDNDLSWGIDPEQFAQFSDINGNDDHNYLSEGKHGFLNQSRFYDLQTSIKTAPVFNSEDHIIRDGDIQYVPGQAIHTSANMWQGGIHGRNASAIWVWERTHGENDNKGSVLHRPDVVAGIGKANLDLNRLAEEVTAFQDAPSEAVILSSQTSRFYAPNYEHATAASYEAASLSGVKIGFVTEKQIAAGGLEEKKMLIVPHATHVHAATLSAIRQFAESGGKVVLVGEGSLQYNEHNEALSSEDRQRVVAGATSADAGATPEQLQALLLPLLSEQGLLEVKLLDESTGELVRDVEWRSTLYQGKRLINIINLDTTVKQVSIEVNGAKIGSWRDLINRSSGSSSAIQLEGYVPLLIEVGQAGQSENPPQQPWWPPVAPPVEEPVEEQEAPEVEGPEVPEQPQPGPGPTFPDVTGHWAAAQIAEAVQRGIIHGYEDGTFQPNRAVTRAEFIVMLARTLQVEGDATELSFSDQASIGQWARAAAAYALQEGWVQGYPDGSFRPSQQISRAEMAVIIARALGLTAEGASSADPFADDASIPAWAKDAVAASVQAGLLQGQGANRFAPQLPTTRAEAVTVLLRIEQ